MNKANPRRFQSLRVSLTQSCNLHCRYCVDPDQPVTSCHELPGAQLAKAVRLLDQALGLKRIKITGGEPLLGTKIDEFLFALGAEPVNFEMGITTNGQRLSQKLDLLKQHGVGQINISIDSLIPENFKRLCGGELGKTLDSIDQAIEMGFQVKLNMVPMKGQNHLECLPMFEFAASKGIQVRYIELMKMGYLQGGRYEEQLFSLEDIVQQIGTAYPVQEQHRPWNGTALLFEANACSFGIIANHSKPFCNDCDRLRISAQGALVGCLSSEKSFSITDLLHLEPTQAAEQLSPLLQQAMSTKQPYAFVGSALGMKMIGG